jgi:GH25 family lysozyme M1 (1,4-beta-N-acetylmuramidase)
MVGAIVGSPPGHPIEEQVQPVHSVTVPHRPHRRSARLVAGLLVAAGLLAVVPSGLATAASAPRAARTATTADATGKWLEGIDVSHWQGTIDWTKVANAGKKFAIIKATESTDFIDDHYATNHTTAKSKGIWTGAYHFARPDSAAGDAVKEADWFAGHIGLGAGDLIPALDLEVAGGLSVTALQNWVKAFVDRVTVKTGVRPMIYTSPAFWKKYMGDSQALADAGYKVLWVAHWGVTAPTVPANNWGGRGWTFWQYSNCGSVPGISGCVDLDRYNGIDLSPVAFSTFKLTAAGPSGGVKQGKSGAASIGIVRTNFDADVQLDVAGLPAGASASFDANPVGDSSAALTVVTDPDPAATPVGTYPLTITGQGNGLTRTTTLNLVVADGIPPKVTVPITRLWLGARIGSSVPVRVSWSASDPSGIAKTGLQRRVNGGSWSTATLSWVRSTTYDVAVANGSTLQAQVRATDGKANTSAWTPGATIRAAIIQQTTSFATWAGSWHTQSTSSASAGSTRYASTKGASVSYRFTGSSIGWIAAKGPTRGSAAVYVDGVYAGTVSLYSSTTTTRVVAFARNFGANGTHTLRIVVSGTAGHPRVDVDAFVRLSIY